MKEVVKKRGRGRPPKNKGGVVKATPKVIKKEPAKKGKLILPKKVLICDHCKTMDDTFHGDASQATSWCKTCGKAFIAVWKDA